jgi:hypothetical protein
MTSRGCLGFLTPRWGAWFFFWKTTPCKGPFPVFSPSLVLRMHPLQSINHRGESLCLSEKIPLSPRTSRPGLP